MPDGVLLPKGIYETWLVRLEEGKAPYSCARVDLHIEEETGNLPPEDIEDIDFYGIAQAVKNGEYLLSQQYE